MDGSNNNETFNPENNDSMQKDFMSHHFVVESREPLPPSYPSSQTPCLPPHPASDYACLQHDRSTVSQVASPYQSANPAVFSPDTNCPAIDDVPLCPKIMVQADTPCPPVVNDQQAMGSINSHVPVSSLLFKNMIFC